MKIIHVVPPHPSRPPVPTTARPALSVGPMTLTCTQCGSTALANFQGMLFRLIECYCAGCGAFYRVTNPAFSGGPKPRG